MQNKLEHFLVVVSGSTPILLYFDSIDNRDEAYLALIHFAGGLQEDVDEQLKKFQKEEAEYNPAPLFEFDQTLQIG